jgi:multidrug efflux pump subunit AcrA (membrane-fusion protein)
VEISCSDAPLKAGYTVDATIITKIVENTVVVPLMSTVREADGKNYVYIMRDDYSVEKRLVELGEYAGIYVEVSNMAEGEKTILNAPAQIKEGVFVKPVVFYAPESRYDH